MSDRPVASPIRADGVAPTTRTGADRPTRIGDWDGACDVDSLGCAAYMSWEYRVLRDIFDDDLGLASPATTSAGASSLVDARTLLERPDVALVGRHHHGRRASRRADRSSPGRWTRPAPTCGPRIGEPDRWTWGRLHTATFKEQTLGESGIGPLEWYFNDGPFPVAGRGRRADATSVLPLRRAYPDPHDPDVVPVGIDGVFDVTNLPSYRLRIDMSDLDGARIIITTGQSGNPFDRHYSDMIDAVADRRDACRFPFTPAAIARRRPPTTLTLHAVTGVRLGGRGPEVLGPEANGDRTSTSGKTAASSAVGAIHSTRRRLTMTVPTSRSDQSPGRRCRRSSRS